MKIGVKYCGGCNPQFQRSNAFKIIENSLKNAVFQYYSPKDSYDIILVIFGCASQCIDLTAYPIFTVSMKELSETSAVIEKIKNQGKIQH